MARGRIRCPACGVDWPAVTARYCGRCGAALRAAALPGAARPSPRRPRRRIVVSAIATLVVSVGVVAAALAAGGIESGEAAADDWEVDLPDPADVEPSPDRAPAPPAARRAVVQDPFACRPDGCLAWETRLGDGVVAVAGDRILHAGRTGVTAIDVVTGAVLWSDRDGFVALGVRADIAGARIHVLDDDLFLLDPADGTLQARGTQRGEHRWEADLGLRHVRTVDLHDEVVVVTGWRDDSPLVDVVALRRQDGRVRWERTVGRAVLASSDPLMLLTARDELAAVDPATGRTRWTRPVLGPVNGLATEAALALVSPTGVDVVDPATGWTVRRVPRPVSNAGPTELIGHLLLVNLPRGVDPIGHPRTDVTVADVGGDDTWRFEGTTGFLDMGGTVVLATQRDDVLVLTALSPEGRERWVRWEVRAALGSDVCCWTLEPAVSDEVVAVIPPDLHREPVRLLEVATGRVTASYHVPIDRRRLDWTAGLGIDRRTDAAVLVGPAGAVEVVDHARLLTTRPQPVLAVDGGLIGLDADTLTGEPRP